MNKNNNPTVLCVWELGGALGHVSRLAAVSRALEERGYACLSALKDLSRAASQYQGTRAQLLQAPVFLPQIKMQRPIVCLADTLLLSGYLKTDELQGLYQAWRNLIQLVNPDVLVLDYAPTAALAALDLSCKKIVVGTGFGDPIASQPMRDWHPYKTTTTEMLQRQETMVVSTINSVLADHQQPSLQYLSDVYHVDSTVITVAPEFDLYGDLRSEARYLCQMEGGEQFPKVQFSGNNQAKAKALAYLNPAHPQLDLILQGLSQASNIDCFVVCPRCNPNKLASFKSEHFRFSVEPVDLTAAIGQADIFINNGNAGSTMQSLLQATPVLALPIHLEHLLTSRKVEELGLGLMLQKLDSSTDLTKAIQELLNQQELKAKLQDYARRHQPLTSGNLGDLIATECDRLLAR